MVDVFTRRKRAEVMSKIRGHGNKDTELALIKLFRSHGITGWRRKQKLFGNPDFVFRFGRVVVFVDGCFWHVCPKHGRNPKSKQSFWSKKLAKNVQRDRLVTRTLRAEGWVVLRIWEHELAHKNERRLLRRLQRFSVLSDQPFPVTL